MIIQHNIMALNAHRQLGGNNTMVAKNLEKLSSGFRINRAGDDAAGLAISEKMRAQITGLTRAQQNAQDGISLVQTAEGALTEVHSMLNRMVDLATQSSNGTMDKSANGDRQKIQDEVNALLEEIDRISASTNFNGINLLDGNLGGGADGVETTLLGGKLSIAGKAGTVVNLAQVDTTGTTSVTASRDSTGEVTLTFDAAATEKITQDMLDKALEKAGIKDVKVKIDGGEFTTSGATADGTSAVTTAAAKKASVTTNGITITANKAGANGNVLVITPAATAISNTKATAAGVDTYTLSVENGKEYSAADVNKMLKDIGADFTVSFEGKKLGSTMTIAGVAGKLAGGAGISGVGGLTLQIGDSSDSFNKVTVSVDDLSAAGLGIAGLDVSSEEAAGNSIQTIKDAINTVSTNRSKLGALQNRLEHTINNIGVATENMTAAESRIRDVDMAKEMMAFTKNNVLTQAAQAMLAQANQQPQQVLQLLR